MARSDFFSLIWNDASTDVRETTAQLIDLSMADSDTWKKTIIQPGFAVFHTKSTVVKTLGVNGWSGVVVGNIYRKTTSPNDKMEIDAFTEVEQRHILESGGQNLTDYFWGDYVVMLQYDDQVLVGRSCTGMHYCFTAEYKNIFLAFSDMHKLPFLSFLNIAVNWDYLALLETKSVVYSAETALEGVNAVNPGEFLSVSPRAQSTKRIRSWKPETFIDAPINDIQHAQELLKQTVATCVTARIPQDDQYAVALSGGLDSSILLAMLNEAEMGHKPLLYHRRSAEGDVTEEHFAQLMAEWCGLTLSTVDVTAEGIRPAVTKPAPLFPLPTPFSTSSESANRLLALLRSNNVQAVFSGLGGDQIFFKRPEMAALLDYSKKSLFNLEYLNIALNTSRLTGDSLWHVLEQGDDYKKSASKQHNNRNHSLTSKEVVEDIHLADKGLYQNPWLTDTEGLPFGKLEQLRQFLAFPRFHNRLGTRTEEFTRINAFIAQPLMETVLRIPSHILLHKGRKRGLARETFRSVLPNEIYAREQKGYGGKSVANSLIQSLPFIRSYILDGILVTNNAFNRDRAETLLNEDRVLLEKGVASKISQFIDMEKWVRTVRDHSNKASVMS